MELEDLHRTCPPSPFTQKNGKRETKKSKDRFGGCGTGLDWGKKKGKKNSCSVSALLAHGIAKRKKC